MNAPNIVPLETWKAGLRYKGGNTNGELDPRALANFRLMLTHHPVMRGKVRHNRFTDEVEVGAVPWRNGGDTMRALTEVDVYHAREWLQSFGLQPTAGEAHAALALAAEANGYDPLTDYLGGLVWDGQPRIDRWLAERLGAADTPLHTEFGRRTMIGAARRALDPGCKHDTMLVLEGEQGIGKSRALRALVPVDDWFGDGVDLGASARELLETTRGKWLCEASELGGLRRADADALKAMLSRQSDRARPAYARVPVEKARRFLLIGTTNPAAGGYLIDTTGNRRFWPVACTNIDLEGIARDRDQLWAEAVAAVKAGERNWLADAHAKMAAEAADERAEALPWAERLEALLVADDVVTGDEALTRLEVPVASRDRRAQMQVADALRALGWTRQPKQKGQRRTWVRQS